MNPYSPDPLRAEDTDRLPAHSFMFPDCRRSLPHGHDIGELHRRRDLRYRRLGVALALLGAVVVWWWLR